VIDGPAGSGKTTLSRRLAERLDAELYHLDAALEGWSGLANLRDRYEHEMLAPLQQDEPAIFPEWDWDNDKVSGSRTLKPTSILIVEGVGGADRIVDGLASLQIWVEVPQAERLRRGIERDGAATEDLWNAWLVEETALHLDQNTRARADLIVDGTQPLPAI
jgi:uridine kinase